MPLIGINPSRGRQEPLSKLEQIALGLDIAQKVLGTTLKIPEYLQERKAKNAQIARDKAEQELIPLRKQELESELGMKPYYKARILSDVSKDFDIVPSGTEGSIEVGPLSLQKKEPPPPKDEVGEKLTITQFQDIIKDHDIVEPGTKGSVPKRLINGRLIHVLKKNIEDPEAYKNEVEAQKSFISGTKDFKDQAAAYDRFMAAENNYAGILSMIRNYRIITDPTVSRMTSDSDIESMGRAANLPGYLQSIFEDAAKGKSLPKSVWSQFRDEAGKSYSAAKKDYDRFESYWVDYAQRNNLNPKNIIVPQWALTVPDKIQSPQNRDLKEELKRRGIRTE